MKIAVVCANGRSGSRIAAEALSRGHDVTAVVRGENRSQCTKVVLKDLLDLTREDLAGFDVVVDAFGTWTPETMHLHGDTARHLISILNGTGTRLIMVGGAASLFTDSSHTLTVRDTPEFPKDWYAVADGTAEALAAARASTNVPWTYVSPALMYDPDGPRTGAYTLAGEELTMNSEGRSYVSYADCAVAIVDLAESGTHLNERVSVVSK